MLTSLNSTKRKNLSDAILSESTEYIKKMKTENLVRIIANSEAAANPSLTKPMLSSPLKKTSYESVVSKKIIPEVTIQGAELSREENRKKVIDKFLKCINFGDMNGLVKVIRDNFSDTSFVLCNDYKDTDESQISGKAGIMMVIIIL